MKQTDGSQPSFEPDWKDIYAELKNKIRWAIGSTAAESGAINLPFTTQTELAGPLAQSVLETLQEMYEKPNLRLVRGARTQAAS